MTDPDPDTDPIHDFLFRALAALIVPVAVTVGRVFRRVFRFETIKTVLRGDRCAYADLHGVECILEVRSRDGPGVRARTAWSCMRAA